MLLSLLCAVYAALAALPAAPDSRVVLATVGGSPDWLLGPLRPFGLDAAAGPGAGELFFVGLVLATALYALLLVSPARPAPRTLLGTVAGLHVLFLLAPPLLSQDVFSYLAYARLGVVHGLDPYASAPLDIPNDPVYGFAGSKDAVSVYGPLFTIGSYALVPLGVAGGLWVLKVTAAVCALATVAVVWRTLSRRDGDAPVAAILLGLNPAWLVHVVGGGHNESLVVLATTAGIVLWGAGRAAAGAALAAAAAALKASAALVLPFLVLGARDRSAAARAVAGATLVSAATVGLALVAFGPSALDGFGLLGANQGRTSSFSFPRKAAEALALVLPGERATYTNPARAAFAAAGLVALAWLALRTWRGMEPVRAAGWATVVVLIASAWLVPWYLAWVLPLAALAGDRRLRWAAVALTAWTLPVAIPW